MLDGGDGSAGTLPNMLQMPEKPTDLALRRNLVAQGFSDPELARAVRDGRIIRLARGAYGAPVSAEQPSERYRRVVAARGSSSRLIVGFESAAALWRAPLVEADFSVVHLIRPGAGGGKISPGRVVHTARLESTDYDQCDGVWCTTPARTLLDVARTSTPIAAIAMGDWMCQTHLVNPESIAGALSRMGRQPGMPQARRTIAFVDGRSESPGESMTRWTILGSRLPAPEVQVEIFDRNGRFVARVDFAFLAEGVVVEFDGRVKYEAALLQGRSPQEALIAEKRREDSLRECGLIVIRIVWADLKDPERLWARLELALEKGRRARAAGLIDCAFRTRPPRRLVA